MEETMEALHDLVKAGKVRYIGCNSMRSWELQKMNHIAEKRGWTEFISMQSYYNLLYREEEREMIPHRLDAGLGGVVWSPLDMGKLVGKDRNTLRARADPLQGLNPVGPVEEQIIDRVAEVARTKGASPAQVAFAWLLSKPNASAVIVSIGKEEHLYDIIGTFNIKLTEEEVQYLEELYTPKNPIYV